MKPDKNTFLGLRTVAYFVTDMAKAKEWYAKIFQVKPYFDEPFYAGFNIGGYELGLQPDEGCRKGESVIAYWGVNDIHSVYERMLSLGATAHQKPLNVGGELMIASVKDPWNNVIGIIYNPEFKAEE